MYTDWRKHNLPLLPTGEIYPNKSVPRVGINGFGHIGRMLLRAATKRKLISVVAINEPSMTIDHMMYLLKYDSTHGTFSHLIENEDDVLYVDSEPISVFHCYDSNNIPWDMEQADYIVECRDKLASKESGLQNLSNNRAKKVIIPTASNFAPNFVMGVNHHLYARHMPVVTSSGSTVNCLAVLAKILNDNLGIIEGVMTSIHALSDEDNTVDSPCNNDWRAGRGSYQNITPTSTDVIQTVGKVIPSLMGKLSAVKYRVPIPDVSAVDFNCKLKLPRTYDQIMNIFREASFSLKYRGIFSVCDDPIVSSDVSGDPHTFILDTGAGMSLNDTFIKLVAWYDNEWAHANRIMDLICYMNYVDEHDDLRNANL